MPNPYKPGGPLLPPKPQPKPEQKPEPIPSKKSAKKQTRRRGKKAAAATPASTTTKTPNSISPYESPENKHEITAAIEDEIETLETVINENKETIVYLQSENIKLKAKILNLQINKSKYIAAIHNLNTKFNPE